MSLASLRGFPYDADEDLDVSSDTLRPFLWCSPWVRCVEGFARGAEGVRGRGFGGARNPSYSKNSSWAPSGGFSFLGFLSEDVGPFRLENMSVCPDRSPRSLLMNPFFLRLRFHVSITAIMVSRASKSPSLSIMAYQDTQTYTLST